MYFQTKNLLKNNRYHSIKNKKILLKNKKMLLRDLLVMSIKMRIEDC
jgi:hypothetical protein